jgi:hypothetical protein
VRGLSFEKVPKKQNGKAINRLPVSYFLFG